MKKIALNLISLFCIYISTLGQNADPYIAVFPTPGSSGLVQLGSTTMMHVYIGNNGEDQICAGTLEVSIVVGLNVEIMGIAPGSDPRWTISSSTTGPGNNVVLYNTGGNFGDGDLTYVYLTIKGVALGGPNNFTGQINYLPIINPCTGTPAVLQGDDPDPTNNYSQSSFTVTAVTPLFFTSFNANGKDCGARVTWSTAQEENVRQFEVQQSFDGNNYNTIATTLSKGAGAHDYSLDVSQAQKRMYYRIVAVDVDGRKLYSNVNKVQLNNCTKASLVQVFPIPANRDEMINMRANQNEIVNYRVLDMSGKQVLSGRFFNNSQIKLATGGSYLIEFIGKSFKETQKIIVQ